MKITLEIDFETETKEVEFNYEYEWENDGIGSYEFWGQPGYDHGTNYVVVYELTWDKKLYTPEENKEIQEQYEKILDAIAEIEEDKGLED